MVFSVPQQTANERGIEGLPQSLSRLHTGFYKPGHSGSLNTLPHADSTWERQLPPEQQTHGLAAKTAQLW